MNYSKIHDNLIERAKNRELLPDIHYQKHHIIPKCEGGKKDGETVKLTHKEHYIVHLLRYKITGVRGNLIAASLMKNTYFHYIGYKNLKLYYKQNGKFIYENKKGVHDPKNKEKVRGSGKTGGKFVYENKIGIHDPKYAKKIRSAQHKNGKFMYENKKGVHDPKNKEKVLEGRKKSGEVWAKPIKTPDGEFPSVRSATRFYGIHISTMHRRLKSKNFPDWHYIEKTQN